MPETTRLCRTCTPPKPLTAFSKMTGPPNARRLQCKDCRKAYFKDHRKKITLYHPSPIKNLFAKTLAEFKL